MKTEYKVLVVMLILTIAIIAGAIWSSNKTDAQDATRLSKPLMGTKMPDQGGQHVARGAVHIAYNSNPPTSGPHWVDVAGGGIKNAPIADELVLHSMEHGAAVVWYREGMEQAEIDKIKEAFVAASGKKILLPRKDLDVPVALTSWGYILKLDTIDTGVIREFIETNNDRAPEKEAI